MKQCVGAFLLFLFLQACSTNEQTHDIAQNVNPEPVNIALNTNTGYTFNPVTGDSTNLLLPKCLTGKPFEAKGKRVPAGEPLKVKAGNPIVVTANTNIHKAGEPRITPLSNTFTAEPGTGTFKLPQTEKCIGKVMPFKKPLTVKALVPRLKDNANCNVQYLDVEQGMNSSYVWSTLEDQKGNIWMTTNGGGVTRYDGQNLTFYTQKEGMSSNVVWCQAQDAKGNFWFGTIGGGVTKFDGQQFTHFTEQQGLARNDVRSILADRKGNLWFGTYGSGVDCYDGKNITHYTTENGLSSNAVLALYEDKKGNIWMGTEDGGAIKFDGKIFTHYTQKQGVCDKTVLAFLEDSKGNMWFGTETNGVNKFDGKSFESYAIGEGLNYNDVRCITEDANGNIWFASNGGGASKFDGETFTWIGMREGVTNNVVWDVMEDRSGNLWFSTFGGGVCRYNNNSFKYYTETEGLYNSLVVSMLEDKQGNVWFGNNGGALTKYDGKQFAHYTTAQGLSSSITWSLMQDSKGNIWIGTQGAGITRFDGTYFWHYGENEGISSSAVQAMVEDRSGNLWIATNGGGLNKFDGRFFTHYTTEDGLPKNAITCLYEDRDGNIWAGTGGGSGGGVLKFDGKNFITYTEKEGMPANFIRCITQDKNGNMWFGTRYGGIARFDGKTFVCYTEKEGLSSNDVRSVKEDANGFLWLSTANGINAIDNRGNGSAKTFVSMPIITTFKKPDGLKALDFLSNSVLLDSKNNIWWGSGKALTVLNLSDFKFSNQAPTIQLNDIELQEKGFDYRNLSDTANVNGVTRSVLKFSGIESFYNYPKELELPHDLNHLTFYFSATDWKSPDKLRYEYILEGADERWSSLGSETKADYRNIPHGHYTFKVRAIGVANKWSKEFSYSFTIRPAWWQTWWFGVVAVICFAMLIYFLFQRRTAALRERQRLLKRLVDERTAEVIEQKKEAEIQRDKAEQQTLLVREKQKEITDSINYAKRIQYSLLAQDELLEKNLPEHFVFFKPKDIVSGDFYWATRAKSDVAGTSDFYFAVCDSTGHGVPGAFISLLNISFLNEAINEKNISAPNEVLNYVRQRLVQNREVGKDGMDGTLMRLKSLHTNGKNEIVQFDYASANNKPLLVRDGKIVDLSVDKMPVGRGEIMKPFNAYELTVQKGDLLYFYSDGFGDQFGGEKGKKYKVKRLQKFILKNHHLPLKEQKQKLYEEFNAWKGNLEQVDDVCVVGIRINA